MVVEMGIKLSSGHCAAGGYCGRTPAVQSTYCVSAAGIVIVPRACKCTDLVHRGGGKWRGCVSRRAQDGKTGAGEGAGVWPS